MRTDKRDTKNAPLLTTQSINGRRLLSSPKHQTKMNLESYSESPPWLTSPSSATHNDNNNHYGSPALSPGSWNVASPETNTSPFFVASPSSSVSSIPEGTTTHDFIGLPRELGQQAKIEKDYIDLKRQKVAEVKAQEMFQAALRGGNYDDDTGRQAASPPRPHPAIDDNGYAARQAAIQRHKEKKRQEKLETLSHGKSASSLPMAKGDTEVTRQDLIDHYKQKKYEKKLESLGVGPASPKSVVISHPLLVAKARKEVLATSTRKKMLPTPEEDYETIQDFKSVVDIEREKEAQQRALNLLKELQM